MLLVRRARVPAALLPPGLAGAADPLEPTVLCDLQIDGDTITRVERSAAASDPAHASVHDAAGALVFPGLVDAHVHLDKTHTWFRAPNRSGTFMEALEALGADRVHWTHADLIRRAEFGLRCAWAHGTRILRTHVDTAANGDETSHAAMAELRLRWRGRIELQTVPLCRGDDYAGPQGEAMADLALRYGASALGGFLVMSADLPRQVDRLLAIARDRRVGIDLHVDENGNPEAEVMRIVAEAALRTAFPYPVICGHACSLARQTPERQRSTIDLLKAARVAVISLPLCNLYLQDRRHTGFPLTPHWRGITLIRDLLAAGVPVACASDNVRDAFYAFGDYDPVEVYVQSVRIAHLDSQLATSPCVVTSTAAALVGRPEFGRIGPGAPAHLVQFGVQSFNELLSRPGAPRLRIDGETAGFTRAPDYAELAG
jgi:cytosine deaminase